MQYTIAAVAAVAVASVSGAVITPQITSHFGDFMTKYDKTYSSDEIAQKMTTFANNMQLIKENNKKNILAGGEAVHGITKFMDLTPAEFKAMYLTYKPVDRDMERVTPDPQAVAASIDWRTRGAVTAVKDQGRCGSCWAFSATEAIESYAMLNAKANGLNGTLMELSPQQINSCDKEDDGCNGGNTESAFDYVFQAGGLQYESDYPYTSGGRGRTGKCKVDKSKFAISIKGYKSVRSGEKNLKAALNNGPVSICLAADTFQSYTGGILQSCDNEVDHCVQGVGYDDTGDQPYWIVRNSWADDWGEEGFIRVAQGKDLCRIADDVTYPIF